MSNDWLSNDEVTTTFGTIKLAQQQAYEEGVKAENDRITRWLLEKGIIRFSLFGTSYVALNCDGEAVLEFDKVGDEAELNKRDEIV